MLINNGERNYCLLTWPNLLAEYFGDLQNLVLTDFLSRLLDVVAFCGFLSLKKQKHTKMTPNGSMQGAIGKHTVLATAPYLYFMPLSIFCPKCQK